MKTLTTAEIDNMFGSRHIGGIDLDTLAKDPAFNQFAENCRNSERFGKIARFTTKRVIDMMEVPGHLKLMVGMVMAPAIHRAIFAGMVTVLFGAINPPEPKEKAAKAAFSEEIPWNGQPCELCGGNHTHTEQELIESRELFAAAGMPTFAQMTPDMQAEVLADLKRREEIWRRPSKSRLMKMRG